MHQTERSGILAHAWQRLHTGRWDAPGRDSWSFGWGEPERYRAWRAPTRVWRIVHTARRVQPVPMLYLVASAIGAVSGGAAALFGKRPTWWLAAAILPLAAWLASLTTIWWSPGEHREPGLLAHRTRRLRIDLVSALAPQRGAALDERDVDRRLLESALPFVEPESPDARGGPAMPVRLGGWSGGEQRIHGLTLVFGDGPDATTVQLAAPADGEPGHDERWGDGGGDDEHPDTPAPGSMSVGPSAGLSDLGADLLRTVVLDARLAALGDGAFTDFGDVAVAIGAEIDACVWRPERVRVDGRDRDGVAASLDGWSVVACRLGDAQLALTSRGTAPALCIVPVRDREAFLAAARAQRPELPIA